MKIIIEQDLKNFNFWAGAKDTARLLNDYELAEIQQYLEEIEPIDERTLNDFFWFETDTICEIIGTTEDKLFSRER